MTDRQAAQQAQRDLDAEAIRTGQKTPAQVRRERDIRRARVKGTAVRPPEQQTESEEKSG